MNTAINDLSFEWCFASKEEAVEKVRQWMNICKRLESKEATAVTRLQSATLNSSAEIAPGYPLFRLVSEFQTREDRRYLIHLLTNLETPKDEMGQRFCFEGKDSEICAWARNGFVVSMESTPFFSSHELNGTIDSECVTIKNISKEDHVFKYEVLLGIRHYERNPKHRKEMYIDNAGRHVSAMDLNDSEAQDLLNQAIEVNGRLYGKRDGRYYCFPRHLDNYYHGFQDNDLEQNVIKKINEKRWE